MKISSTKAGKLHFIRLNKDDDILLTLRKVVEEKKIKTGFIMNGLGSVQSYHYHVVADCNIPPAESFPKAEEPCDVIAVTGMVIDGRVHAHIILSDSEKAQGGHLEEGTRVLTFTVIVIMEAEELSFTDWDGVGIEM
ncbi:MAG: DNA-binding protein [Spirochaetales bacterium]|uniref:DNA-binding protein n=1 Tax=Candidatus Thalassospirochaeta sargassi TaxID=3119039 RepID=A0AAJ1IDV4_9SPIO|nr:DNA-binding protein [Spirochaetales bacterium]